MLPLGQNVISVWAAYYIENTDQIIICVKCMILYNNKYALENFCKSIITGSLVNVIKNIHHSKNHTNFRSVKNVKEVWQKKHPKYLHSKPIQQPES